MKKSTRTAAPFVSAECDNGHKWTVKDDFKPFTSGRDGHHDLGQTRFCPECGALWKRLTTAPRKIMGTRTRTTEEENMRHVAREGQDVLAENERLREENARLYSAVRLLGIAFRYGTDSDEWRNSINETKAALAGGRGEK